MNRGIAADVLEVLKAGPPLRRSEDPERIEAAAVRHRVSWQRVLWAILDLSALLELRAELANSRRSISDDIRAHGLASAPNELLAELSARVDQTRAVLRAFIFEGKVLLDLLSKAVVDTLGAARGFGEKHDNLATRLDRYADTLGVARPPAAIVERARDLEERLANVRDYILVHPKMENTQGYARAYVHPHGSNLQIGTLFPDDEEEEARTIDIDELASGLEVYARDLMLWVASVVSAAS